MLFNRRDGEGLNLVEKGEICWAGSLLGVWPKPNFREPIIAHLKTLIRGVYSAASFGQQKNGRAAKLGKNREGFQFSFFIEQFQ